MIPDHSAKQAITLAQRGWNLSEIARHLGHDRKTIRIYLNGNRQPGQPREHADSFVPFAAYAARRVRDDPHLRAAGLHRELAELGYLGSYSALTRELRNNGISSHCAACLPKPSNPSPPTPIGLQRYRPAQSLPIHLAPLAGETVASYLTRLAAANHIPVTLILALLPSWFTARTVTHDDLCGATRVEPADLERLAALAGLSTTTLLHALPAFGFGHRPHTGRPPMRATNACRRCAARHGHTDPIPVHQPAHHRLCSRHQIWLGDTYQVDLTADPEIMHAHRQATRLARRHGVLRLLHAEITARQQITTTHYPHQVQARIAKLTVANPGLVFEQPDLIDAAAYPETISDAARGLDTNSTS